MNINFKDWRDYVVPLEQQIGSTDLSNSVMFFTQTHKDNATNIYANTKKRDVSNDEKSSQHQDYAVKIVFLIGQPQSNDTQQKIINESDMYGDVIQESFIDSYNNLTLKTIMMLKWVNGNCYDKGE